MFLLYPALSKNASKIVIIYQFCAIGIIFLLQLICIYSSVIASNAERIVLTGTISIESLVSLERDL